MFVLVAYDIPHDKRRLQVMKALQDYGSRVQYSVFECDLTGPQVVKLRSRLKSLIVPADDDVRFYFLCEQCVPRMLRLGHPKAAMRWRDSSLIV